MFKKILSKAALIIALGLFVSGCKGSASSSTLVQNNSGDVTITWWSFPVFSQEDSAYESGTYEKEIIKAFEASNPGIKVNLKMIDFTTGPDKITSAIEGGSMGDVLFDAPGRIISYAKSGYLADLNNMFTDDFIEDVNNSSLIDSCMDNGSYYMYPISSSPFYMAFNKDMLDDAGVSSYVKEGWTVSDFTTVLTALHDKGYAPGSIYYNGSGGDQGTRAFLSNLYDGHIINNELNQYTVNSQEMIESFDYVKKAIDSGLISNGIYINGSNDIANFVNGNTSFTLLWSTGQQTSNQAVLDLNKITTVSVPFPSIDGRAELEYLVNGFCVFDNGDEARIEASQKFIDFICNDDDWGPKDVIQTGCFPVRSSLGQLYNDATMKMVSNWTQYYSVYYNTVDGFSSMRDNWEILLRDIIYSDYSITESVDSFTVDSNSTLNAAEDK